MTATAIRLVDQLNHVIAHDRAALDACEAAAHRIDAIRPRYQVREMVNAHLTHIDKLSQQVKRLGGEPTRAKHPMPRPREDMKGLEDDHTLLCAVLENEEKVTDAYEEVTDHGHSFADLEATLPRFAMVSTEATSGLRLDSAAR